MFIVGLIKYIVLTMKRQIDNDDGVSPVIGTILLVAITIVLVAIVSVSALGIASHTKNTHIVGVHVISGDANELLVTIACGDTEGLDLITVYTGSQYVDEVTFTSIGVPMSFKNTTSLKSGVATISVIGHYADGNQILYSGKVFIV